MMQATMAADGWRRWAGLAALLAGSFMTVMDAMIVNVAIPGIRRDFGAGIAPAQLVVAGYGLAYAVMLIAGGRLGDLMGRRRMFLAGLAGFTAASALCGLAPSAAALIGARVLQGIAAALLFPQVLSLIRVGFPEPAVRARAFAVMGVAMGLAAIAGQLLGGLLVAANLGGLGWRPIFLVNLPVGLAALAAAPALLSESRAPGARGLDLAGTGLSALGLGLLLYPLVEGRTAGWPAWSIAMLAAALPTLALFAAHQHRLSRRRASPLVDTALFRDRGFALGILVVLLFYSTINSFYLALAFLLQQGLGRSPLEAGLTFTPLAAAFMAASLAAGRAGGRGRVLVAGAAVATLGSALCAATALTAAPLTAIGLLPALVVLGAGEGLVMTPLLNAMVGRLPERHAGAAAGLVSTMQQVGGAAGIAIVGLLAFGGIDRDAGAAAYRSAFVAAALYGAAATIAALALLPLALARPALPATTA